MPPIDAHRLFHPLVLLAVLGMGVFLRTRHFSDEIAGHHCFRQAHVASNIHFLVKDGLGLRTKHFNKWRTRTIYDGPLYQNSVASLCLATGLPVVAAARIINIAIYLATCLVLLALMATTRVAIRTALMVIFLYSLSPLGVYYDRAIIPDNLAVLFSLVSLLAYLRWHQAVGLHNIRRLLLWSLMTLAGLGSAFIKPPVMLPVMFVVLIHWFSTASWRHRPKTALVAFSGIVLATVIAFTVFSNQVNYGAIATPASDWTWYFSDLAGRRHLGSYQDLLDRVYEVLATPPVFTFAFLGMALALVIRSQKIHIIYCAWPVAALVTMLLFFNVHRLHDYYQIPFVFILCFFAGHFLGWFEVQFHQMAGLSQRAMRFVRISMPLGLIAFVVAAYQYHHIPFIVDEQARSAGVFIRENSPSDAFVIYLVAEARQRPNEYWLWLAQREGYNLNVDEFSSEALSAVATKHVEGHHQALLFVPATLSAKVDARLDPLPLKLAAHSNYGDLYSLAK